MAIVTKTLIRGTYGPVNTIEIVDDANDPGFGDNLSLGYRPGSRWINQATGNEFVLISSTETTADWRPSAGPAPHVIAILNPGPILTGAVPIGTLVPLTSYLITAISQFSETSPGVFTYTGSSSFTPLITLTALLRPAGPTVPITAELVLSDQSGGPVDAWTFDLPSLANREPVVYLVGGGPGVTPGDFFSFSVRNLTASENILADALRFSVQAV